MYSWNVRFEQCQNATIKTFFFECSDWNKFLLYFFHSEFVYVQQWCSIKIQQEKNQFWLGTNHFWYLRHHSNAITSFKFDFFHWLITHLTRRKKTEYLVWKAPKVMLFACTWAWILSASWTIQNEANICRNDGIKWQIYNENHEDCINFIIYLLICTKMLIKTPCFSANKSKLVFPTSKH